MSSVPARGSSATEAAVMPAAARHFSIPAGVQSLLHAEVLLDAADAYLPFFSIGMGGVLPACIGLVIGLLLHMGNRKPA